MKQAAALVLVLVIAIAAAASLPSGTSAGAPAKKLFSTRWYQQPAGDYGTWMTLSTSPPWFECGSSVPDCRLRWRGAIEDAIDDWNSQETTVKLDVKSDQNPNYDVNIHVSDLIVGDPALLGIALPYDETENLCVSNCTIRYSDVMLADDAHVGPYAPRDRKQATTAHELGHVFALRHESVNSDESILYQCGFDDTGPIPVSIMAYDCINLSEIGGQALNEVQPWDVCGVNHAYYDPTIGYAECDSGPTSSPGPWVASNFAWYLAVSPDQQVSECDHSKPVPPNDPLDIGLCTTFDLVIDAGTYTYRQVWSRNGTVVFDGELQQFLETGEWEQQSGTPVDPGTWKLELYADGAFLGESEVVVTGGDAVKQGDANCSGGIDIGDVAVLLQMGIGNPPPPGCATYQDNPDCLGGTGPIDALAVAVYLSGADPLPVGAQCPGVGEPVLT